MTTSTKPRIVVGVDGSDGSKNALRWAKRISEATGASIDVIGAWEVTSDYGWSALPPYVPVEDVDKELNTAVDEVFGHERPADIRLLTRQGGAAHVLTEASRDAFMVVVGSRGHGGFAGLLLGSVSSKVAEHSSCPVLVVHGDHAQVTA
jgi:nucleotide-binding universal stress UspA family protein